MTSVSSTHENLLETTAEVENSNPYSPSVSKLSKGFLSLYNSPLVNTEKQLKELTSKQEFLIDKIHNENLRISEVQHSPEIQDTFVKLKIYQNKLVNLKKDMKLIYERSTKLKKRALRLQQIKENEDNKTKD